jgi:hypothetical protein
MAGFLSESTRDWLTVIGIALAVLQTVLAFVVLRAPGKHAAASRARRAPGGFREAVARFAPEVGTTERGFWLWILGVCPGVTLVALGLFALAPLPPSGTLVEDDGGFLVALAHNIQILQGIAGLVLAGMLASAIWPDEDGGAAGGNLSLPSALGLLVLGAAGGVTLQFALHLIRWADSQPVSVMMRLASSTAMSLVFPALVCLMALPFCIITAAIDRWLE